MSPHVGLSMSYLKNPNFPYTYGPFHHGDVVQVYVTPDIIIPTVVFALSGPGAAYCDSEAGLLEITHDSLGRLVCISRIWPLPEECDCRYRRFDDHPCPVHGVDRLTPADYSLDGYVHYRPPFLVFPNYFSSYVISVIAMGQPSFLSLHNTIYQIDKL